MNHNYERTAFWLLPDSQHIQKLNGDINFLANKYKGPIFRPHVTMGVGNFQSPSEVEFVLNSLSINVSEFSLTAAGFGFENTYTKCCYIKFKEESSIFLLANEIANRIPDGKTYQFIPHLSLFYGKLIEPEQEYISKRILLPDYILFTELVAMGIPRANQTKSDVEKWVELKNRTLMKR